MITGYTFSRRSETKIRLLRPLDKMQKHILPMNIQTDETRIVYTSPIYVYTDNMIHLLVESISKNSLLRNLAYRYQSTYELLHCDIVIVPLKNSYDQRRFEEFSVNIRMSNQRFDLFIETIDERQIAFDTIKQREQSFQEFLRVSHLERTSSFDIDKQDFTHS